MLQLIWLILYTAVLPMPIKLYNLDSKVSAQRKEFSPYIIGISVCQYFFNFNMTIEIIKLRKLNES